MEVWVVFIGGFLDIAGGEYAEWTWDFYKIYNSEAKAKAKEAVASLRAELDEEDNETDYKIEKHLVQ